MDLLRKLLLKIEQVPPQQFSGVEVEGYTPEEVAYHARLADDAGFIEARFLPGCEEYRGSVQVRNGQKAHTNFSAGTGRDQKQSIHDAATALAALWKSPDARSISACNSLAFVEFLAIRVKT